jgi:hypothetical protein
VRSTNSTHRRRRYWPRSLNEWHRITKVYWNVSWGYATCRLMIYSDCHYHNIDL